MKGFLAFAMVAALALAHNDGQLTISVNGQDQTVYVVGADWVTPMITVSGRSVTLRGGGRAYIAKSADDQMNPDFFDDFDLKGSTVTYTVDLSQVGCSCNAAFYTSQMPGHKWDGSSDPTDGGDYYCDANRVGGEYCPEMDILESNKYTFATTPHTCNDPNNNHYDWCDGAGKGTNIFNVDNKAFCPDGSCKINTSQPFTKTITFNAPNGQLTSISVLLEQNGNQFNFDACDDQGYLSKMGDQLKGSVFVYSLWGNTYGTMQWLDGMTGCQGDCDIDNT